jgi:hypothetical protein
MPEDRPPTARELGNATAAHYIGILRGSLITICAVVLAARSLGVVDPALRVFAWIGCALLSALGVFLIRLSVRRIAGLRAIRSGDAP